MNATDLRASILQAAIEGKLVPQLESEPEVEQIGEVSEEVPFEIPKKWKWLRLAFLVEKARQKVPDKTFYYVDVSSVSSGKGLIGKMAIIEAKQAPSRARKIVEEGMVLFSTVRPYLKNVCLALKIPKETIASTAFATFSCSAYLNNRFALYVLTSPYFMNYVAQVQKGVAYPAISDKDFYSAYIPFPPLAEQHRIVARLNELLPLVDDFGEAQEAFTIAQTEFPGKLKASLLQAAIEGKLVPQLESEPEVEQIGDAPEQVPFEIPDKWKWGRLQDVGSFISGWTPKAEELQKMCSIGCVPYFKIADMNQQGNEIWLQKTSSFLKKSERTRTFFRGTIVYPKNGGAVFTNKRRLLNQESVVDLNTGGYVPGKFLDIGYAYNIFLGLDFRTISKGTALPTLDQTKLRNYLIPLPPLAEQRRIVAKVNELLSLLDELH